MKRPSATSASTTLAGAASRRKFRSALVKWYEANKRDLPWRIDRDPYHVWVSEIMLQQTRVAVVVDYYQRFLKRFPTVQSLAAARLDSVLAAWSGLGYYRRARSLHAAAKEITHQHRGRFPRLPEEWRQLPGIGRYTAAAIASIAFDEPAAVVDGNVERVLWRITGQTLDRERTWELASRLLAPSRAGDFNQGIMELGATVCLPRNPKCLVCPMQEFCATRGELPLPAASKRQKRKVYYSLSLRDGAVLLVRRARDLSLMAGMWELPEIDAPQNGTKLLKLRHSITVTNFLVHVCQNGQGPVEGGRWFPRSRLSALPLTGLTRKILRTAAII